MRVILTTAAVMIAAQLSIVARAADLDARAAATRDAIEDNERRQRDVMARFYSLGQSIKTSAKRNQTLTRRAAEIEVEARRLGAEVRQLEDRSAERGRQMNKRLGSLYRRRAGVDALRSVFAAESPAELDRHRRYLRVMIEDDHRQVNAFLDGLREARARRLKLAGAVRRLVIAQREARAAAELLATQKSEEERLIAEIERRRDSSLTELRALRAEGAGRDLAFFEKRGSLASPVAGRVTRGFGTVNDPSFKFKLMHKGWFYGGAAGAKVAAIAGGRVEVARDLPGWGPTVVIDHGDHYHSVYACAARIKVRENDVVLAGQLIGFTGERSPLFGPGLYFELRHFADAIDPRSWIKDPNFTFHAQLGVNK